MKTSLDASRQKVLCGNGVVNVSPGAYPSGHALGDNDKIEEERRVLYVAMTRAKDELIVTRHGHEVWTQRVDKTDG